MNTQRSAANFKKLRSNLNEIRIDNWFDLKHFLDELQSRCSKLEFEGSLEDFLSKINRQGIAIITFEYGIDGVSTEIIKYIRVMRNMFDNINIHLIGGEFNEIFERTLHTNCKHYRVKGMTGFTKWKLYKRFFKTKLTSDHEYYTKSLHRLWQETIDLCEKIGRYLVENEIALIYAVNINSNPGNIALALAVVILSEFLHIPVMNNNHDFYWESGRIEKDTKYHEGRSGSRDLYFKNYRLKEFFSVLETIYPWRSPIWLQVNINKRKSRLLIKHHGCGIEDVSEIGTAIDLECYRPSIDKRRHKDILAQMDYLFSNSRGKLYYKSIENLLSCKISNPLKQPLLCGYKENHHFEFQDKTMIFLQPTRIIERKRIQDNFKILSVLFKTVDFQKRFMENKYQYILFLISGPMIIGHEKYFKKILRAFSSMLNRSDIYFREKIFLGCLFSSIDRLEYCAKFDEPIKMNDLFNIASMITLPSETEGRGLPIVEAAACQVPIITRRYYPEEVYANVIGEDLPDSERLKVIEFHEKIHPEFIRDVIVHLFENKDLQHNRRVIEKRYNFGLLEHDLQKAFEKLYLKLSY